MVEESPFFHHGSAQADELHEVAVHCTKQADQLYIQLRDVIDDVTNRRAGTFYMVLIGHEP